MCCRVHEEGRAHRARVEWQCGRWGPGGADDDTWLSFYFLKLNTLNFNLIRITIWWNTFSSATHIPAVTKARAGWLSVVLPWWSRAPHPSSTPGVKRLGAARRHEDAQSGTSPIRSVRLLPWLLELLSSGKSSAGAPTRRKLRIFRPKKQNRDRFCVIAKKIVFIFVEGTFLFSIHAS